ncbi:hypothetical protein CQ393_10155 [Stenotrophomonas sp. MYb238]|uniref:hypothetical protein n=1 Tax=Stenotrophomonas sp. MYb238 TaxID=2040281 RepID=UPI0012921698|nr:hypothetical protein [Stenotrophomonas sp. MYb238]MQP76255.1 hypothetical protein [Stenotrophomonas sp. MYb238]
MPSKHVFEALSDKGVTELHHANSVATACQFLRSRALMSRGTVERSGLTQTPQSSDDADRRYSIWFDVFLDSVDIHARASRANAYGPVLFVFDLALIDRNKTGRIWVTKLNPTKWVGEPDEERWFQGKEDLEGNFVKGQFDQMIVLRHCGGSIPFGRHLKKIVVDDPDLQTEDDVDIYSMGIGALRLAMQDVKLDVPIERRRCRTGCACKNHWRGDDERLFRMFDPMP